MVVICVSVCNKDISLSTKMSSPFSNFVVFNPSLLSPVYAHKGPYLQPRSHVLISVWATEFFHLYKYLEAQGRKTVFI